MTATAMREPLLATDRCDRCGAQAFVRAVFPGGSELLFCRHHAREFADGLSARAVEIIDESDRLAGSGSG